MINYYRKKEARSLKDMLDSYVDFDEHTGLKRGMVLRICRSKILKAAGADTQPERRKMIINAIEKVWLTGNKAVLGSPGYERPVLIVKLRSASPWIAELHAMRFQINEVINERIGSDFLREVRIGY